MQELLLKFHLYLQLWEIASIYDIFGALTNLIRICKLEITTSSRVLGTPRNDSGGLT